MSEDKIKMLLDSYDLDDLLNDNDITEEYVLTWLIENDMVDLDDYFDPFEPLEDEEDYFNEKT